MRSLLLAAVLVSSRDINHLLGRWGYWLVLAIVFLQSAGVPVPGTTALIAAALYAGTTHHLAIGGVVAAACVGASAGFAIGFAVGRHGGWLVLRRYGHHVRLTEERLELGRRFFAAHGGKVVFFGRFVTGLRTWGGFIAGANRMPWSRFLILNIAGGVAWAVSNGLGYYYFGHLLTSLSTPVNVALAIAGICWIGVSLAYVRRRARGALLREPITAELSVDPTGRGSST